MILKVDKVTKNFGGVTAIKETSFSVAPKEIYGLIGPNGAGKTTMFNIITGNYEASEGEVFFRNETLHGLKPHQIVRRGVARTFQNIRLFKSMSVLDNVLIGFDFQARYSFAESILRLPRFFGEEKRIRAKAMEILKYLGIEKFAEHKATDLSYGQQRKVEIARALATNPELLLLDEPAAGMNPAETKELADLIYKAREDFDLTVLLIEHDMKFVNQLCDRVLVLDYGKSIFEGKPSDAIKDPEVVAAYLGDFIHD
ncbi:MAG TPA: high-affinity branched-chain amino acid ABC transporter ATP-binding protein LivG [Sulfurospirillum sp. UBA11407]|jgi:branched-chain amino acid transport system ATP-binding protein|nr:MAG TPA: high-affinity branched-chain amino acid ABC transporter ATP-binding protein LivG [Sulfurospirillum sp. UBA11407]DAB34688.1 MAG TPA: high-affinity branched-chain amino acid ABC transporter ATP-binding protein LivG [Sulfurospirillum sp. UBA12182]